MTSKFGPESREMAVFSAGKLGRNPWTAPKIPHVGQGLLRAYPNNSIRRYIIKAKLIWSIAM